MIVYCKHCDHEVVVFDDESTIDDPYVYVCPHCGKHSEEEVEARNPQYED